MHRLFLVSTTPFLSRPVFRRSNNCNTTPNKQTNKQYHYYRAYSAYNAIRVFVSAYVWMTGFGNFLYFDKKQDFSITRALSMWLRINYFPILLSVFVGVEFDLFYIVPLHTTAFFITMATCYLAKTLEQWYDWPIAKRNLVAIGACLLVHLVFYETPLKNVLLIFSKEIHFRFQADKYSAPLGILSGYFWATFRQGIQWAHTPENNNGTFTTDQVIAQWGQRVGGVVLMAVWWIVFGSITDKFVYNPIHPFIFWMPIAGFLMVRNSSKYLTEIHSTALEFFGQITLETYVLQFHVFMNHKVQNIPVVVPGATADGPWILKTLNMLLTGVAFVALAYWARKITVTTQTTCTDLLILLTTKNNEQEDGDDDLKAEKLALMGAADSKTLKVEEGKATGADSA
jgi:N-acetylneuraminate 9-O-acetyltransferase